MPPAPRSTGSRLALADAARLHMSRPDNPMVISIVLRLDGALSQSALLALLEQRLRPYPRFRQRVVASRRGLGTPRWQEQENFELSAHVQRVRCSAPESASALEDLVGELISTPLALEQPPWQMHYLEPVQGGSALLVRLHHCLGDGVTLVSMLHALSDEAWRPEPALPAAAAAHPSALPWRSLAGVAHAARFALAPPDPPSPLRGRLGTEKRVAFSDALSLEQLLSAARAHQATVTALLLTALAGALARWQPAGKPPLPRRLRALVPVNLHAGPGGPSNQFASVFVSLPIAAPDRLARLERVREQLARIQRHRGARLWGRLIELAGLVTPALAEHAVRIVSHKSSVVVSSVPGPHEVLHLGGLPLRDVFVCAPAPGEIALSVTLISYAGRVRLSVLADPRVIADARALLRLTQNELEHWLNLHGAGAAEDRC